MSKVEDPLHVLWLPSWYPTAEDRIKGNFFQEQAQALVKHGINLGVIYPEIRPLKDLRPLLVLKNYFQKSFQIESGVPIVRMHGWNCFPRMPQKQMEAWIQYAEQLMEEYVQRRGKPDLIHAHSVLWGGIAAQVLSEKFQIPFLITEHFTGIQKLAPLGVSLDTCWSRNYICTAYQKAAKILAVGETLKRVIENLVDKDVTICPNFFDDRFFTLKSKNNPNAPFCYLNIGQLSPNKNQAMLLRAFKQVYEQNKNVRLEIGGSGRLKAELENQVQNLGLNQVVKFLGGISRSEVLEAMHRSDAFVLSSSIETFGIVVIEALATGLPVVSTICGGPEGIVNKENGILVPANDEKALYKAMKAIQFKNYAQIAIRQSVEEYSQSVVVKKLIKQYQSIL